VRAATADVAPGNRHLRGGGAAMAGSVGMCSGCDARWGGVERAHCASCHRTFAGVWLFDKHRAVTGCRGRCQDPAGLVEGGKRIAFLRDDGIWHGPQMTAADRARRGWPAR
jgi:hypothetical protein